MAAQFSVAEIRRKIAAGEIKRNSGSGAGPDNGIYKVQFDGVEFGPGENGNLRGQIKCRVIEAQDTTQIGKKFNIFLQTVDAGYAERSIAEFTEYFKVWGIPEERIYDDANNYADVIGNICLEMQRLAIKGRITGIVDRKPSEKPQKNGKPGHYNDIQEVFLAGAPTPVAAPVVTPVVTPVTPTAVPVQAAPMAAIAAMAAAPAAAPVSNKPWRQ